MRTRANKVGFVIRGCEIFPSVIVGHPFLKGAAPVAAKFDLQWKLRRIQISSKSANLVKSIGIH